MHVPAKGNIHLLHLPEDFRHAERLRGHLEKHFPGSVLLTKGSLGDFPEPGTVVLVLIGPTWSEVSGQKKWSRLRDADNYVREDLLRASKFQYPIIPVLFGSASPSAVGALLPPELRFLQSQKSLSLTEEYYPRELARLVEVIERVRGGGPRRDAFGAVPLESFMEFERPVASENLAPQPEPHEESSAEPDEVRNLLHLSASVTKLINQARRRSAERSASQERTVEVSSGLILFEIVESGRVTPNPARAADLLRTAITNTPENRYEAVRDEYFKLKGLSLKPVSQEPQTGEKWGRMSPGLRSAMDWAQQAALFTTGGSEIHLRHLVAALLAPVPESQAPYAQTWLKKMGLDLKYLRTSLFEYVVGYGDNDMAWATLLEVDAPAVSRLSGFHADDTRGTDLLDIEQDVLAFATLMAARTISPPLSIGLFGDWGSGKTFFMRQLRRTVDSLSSRARASGQMQKDTPFYKRIVQIEFNAWHYVEGNLWASLVEHIFDNLRVSHEEDRSVSEKLQEHLLKELKFRELADQDASEKAKQAKQALDDAEGRLATAQQAFEAKANKLARLSAKDLHHITKLPEVAKSLTQLRQSLGLGEVSAVATDLQAGLTEVRSLVQRGSSILMPLLQSEDKCKRRFFLAGALLLPLAVAVLAQRIPEWVSTELAGLLTLLGTGTSWAVSQLKWLSGQVEKVEGVQREYEKQMAEQRELAAVDLKTVEREVEALQAEYTAARQRRQEAEQRLQEANAELQQTSVGKLLARFIEDRAASNDYRKHLGVLALVRDDFENLSNLIEEENWRLAPPTPGESPLPRARPKFQSLEEEEQDKDHRINRIILYIDDLDRCPPNKVVEVLQAVHLLLAFPLFVVVVGVDARWLARSLEIRYRELIHAPSREAASLEIQELAGAATAKDYLEKIFQIPFWLKLMEEPDSARMLQGLLAGSLVMDAPEQDAPAAVSDEKARSKDDDSVKVEPWPDNPPAEGAVIKTEPPPPVAPNLESLEIRQAEMKFIRKLVPLLGSSPRALKRFVNVYRLIKAGLAPHALHGFVSDAQMSAHKIVLFLLALDTGMPVISSLLFQKLQDEAEMDVVGSMPFQDAASRKLLELTNELASLVPPSARPDWQKLQHWLLRDEEHLRFNPGLSQLQWWAQRVARYSFRMDSQGSTPTSSAQAGQQSLAGRRLVG